MIYEVDLYGRWSRTDTSQYEASSVRGSLELWGLRLFDWQGSQRFEQKFNFPQITMDEVDRQFLDNGDYATQKGEFHVTTEIEARSAAEALEKCQKNLRKALRTSYCRAPRLTFT